MPSNNNCCVVGCTNNYSRCPPGTRFYAFPRKDDIRFPGRRERWKELTGRPCGKDGVGGWSPTKNSRICSQHFIGGKKVDHPFHPAYVPSFFPEKSKYQRISPAVEGTEVARKTKKLSAGRTPLGTARQVNEDVDLFQELETILQNDETQQDKSCHKAIQLDLKVPDDGPVVFYCDSNGSSKATMARIPRVDPLDYLIIETKVPDDEADLYVSA